MTTEQEEQYLGNEPDEVPRIEPDKQCNGKKVKREDESGETVFAGYCNARAGKGTDHLGEGRCKYHGGCSPGAPEGNQRAQTHALNADPHHYFQSLPPEQKEYVRDVAASIRDRIRARSGTVDYLDRVMARRIAIELHIVSKASDYVENVSGLTETIFTEYGSHEKKTALLDEIRKRDRTIFRMLKEVGVLDDPESQKEDSLESWRVFVDGGDS